MKVRTAHQTVPLKKDTEHHMEFVAEQKGVTYINDSASIDIKQTIRSIDGIDAELVLVIGGNDERTDYTWFLNIGLQKIKAVIYLGRDPKKIFRLFGKYDCLFVTAISIEEAVDISRTIAKQNQAVLFSPACSSYEAFDNYKNRGNLFKQLVLKEK